MEIEFAIGLAGAVIGFGGGFVTAAIITIGKCADMREDNEALVAIIKSQSCQLAGYREVEQNRARQRKAARAKAQEINAARNATKPERSAKTADRKAKA